MEEKRNAGKRAAPRKARKPASGKAAPAKVSRPKAMKTRRIYRRFTNEFKPDAPRVSVFKPLRFTKLQRLQVTRWALYIGLCVFCLILQDTLMSRVHILGAVTDLPAAALLTAAVLEGSEIGSILALIGSLVYYFSGSAPGPYCVGLLTLLGTGASLLRERYLHRSAGAIIICAQLAVMVYEVCLYIVGLFLGLTFWLRLPVFVLTGLLTCLTVFPLYHLFYRIGLIGGNIWKE